MGVLPYLQRVSRTTANVVPVAGSPTPAEVTVVLVPFDNAGRASTRLLRDLAPSLSSYPDWKFEILIIDNSKQRLDGLADALGRLPWPSRYLWHGGKNLFYGPALNLAVRLASHPFLIYLCTEHGRMQTADWIGDLVRPLQDNARAAMTGHPQPSPHPSVLHFRANCRRFHIQGGVFAARTEVLRRYRYNEGRYAHAGSDIWQSYQLQHAGFELVSVPSVVSVWQRSAPAGQWSYVHDSSEGST